MPKGKLQRQLRSRRKVILVLLLFLAFTGYAAWNKYCQYDACLSLLKETFYLRLALAIAVSIAVIVLCRRRLFGAGESGLSAFALRPHEFNECTLELYGRVEYILSDTVLETAKRKIVDAWRTATDNSDTVGRYVHQRFLISSPALYPGERLAVHHNTKFGKIALKRGSWLHVKGQYVHRPPTVTKLLWSAKARYGLIHLTHGPGGFLEKLHGAPGREQAEKVGVTANTAPHK